MRILVLIAAVASLTQASTPPAGKPSGALNPADMDPDCAACSDFNRFANGGWLDRATIPAGRGSWSTYHEVDRDVRSDLDAIVQEGVAAARAGSTGDLAKIGTYYATCMDEAAADRAGAEPLRADLARLDSIRTPADVTAALRYYGTILPDFVFHADIGTDLDNPRRMMLHLAQGGLTLPEETLYFDQGKEGQEARDTLRKTATEMFRQSGLEPARAAANADRVLEVETALAAATLPPEKLRDSRANFHPITLAELQRQTPHWDWASHLESLGAPQTVALDLSQPAFFAALDKALVEREPTAWAAYMRWHLLRASSRWLSKPFRDSRQAFSAHFTGSKGEQPRSEQCTDALSDGLGRLLGAIYQKRHFSSESRRRGERMVVNLKAAMADRIRTTTWMTPITRRKALAKLAAMQVYLGGPAKAPDFSALEVKDGPFWANVARANVFSTRYYTGLLARPVDRSQWYLLPQDVSGGADYSRNVFHYPTGKFQPPFFDPTNDDALNYGALGATMGHEITHLFDDQGRQFDAEGRLRDWWTEADDKAYKARAGRLAAQYDATIVGGERVNGRLTIGENIADLGGLTIAYYALQRELRGKPRRLIDGFTPEQRFFLAWARNFRERVTPESLRRQVKSDEHAPSEARILIPLANMPEFQRAFGCKPGDKRFLAPAGQVRIW